MSVAHAGSFSVLTGYHGAHALSGVIYLTTVLIPAGKEPLPRDTRFVLVDGVVPRLVADIRRLCVSEGP